MSESRMRRAALVLAVLAPLTAVRAGAQDDLAAAQRSYLAAARRSRALRARVDSVEKAEKAAGSADTISSGSVIIRVPSRRLEGRIRAAVVQGTEAAARVMDASTGPATAARLRATPLILDVSSDKNGLLGIERLFHILRFPGVYQREVHLGQSPTAEAVKVAALDLLGAAASVPAPVDTRMWLGTWVPLGAPPAKALEDSYIALATSISSRAHACLRGVMADCDALILAPENPPDAVSAWYLPSDLPLATRMPRDSVSLILWKQCREGRADSVCLVAAREFGVIDPFPRQNVKRTVAAVALQMGGAGAVDRLVTTNGPMADVLAATARAPWPEVRAKWLAAVTEAKPAPPAPTLRETLSFAMWTAIFGIVATRSRVRS